MRNCVLIGLVVLTFGFRAATAQSQTVVDYTHRDLNCEWLTGEYQRILDRNEQEPIDRGYSGWHISLNILTLPMRFLDLILGATPTGEEATDLQGTVKFSGAVEDVRRAALRKECFALIRKMNADQDERGNVGLKATPTVSAFEN